MAANFVSVESIDTLNALFEESHIRPVALFKHSNSCGISSHILEQIGDVDADVHVIVVQRDRPLSNAVAERTGYRHQSPQAFVIKDGKAVYHATHYGIRAEDIEEGLKG
jgi:bacillithiol system protein YtxJ